MIKDQYRLIKQYPHPKSRAKYPEGTLCIQNHEALFLQNFGNTIYDKLLRPEIIHMNHLGIMFRGFEENGVDKTGRVKYLYQEWYCVRLEAQNG